MEKQNFIMKLTISFILTILATLISCQNDEPTLTNLMVGETATSRNADVVISDDLTADDIIRINTENHKNILSHIISVKTENDKIGKYTDIDGIIASDMNKLPAKEFHVVNMKWDKNNSLSLENIPEPYLTKIKNAICETNYYQLEVEINKTYDSIWYKNLPVMEQTYYYICLSLVKNSRDNIIEVASKYITPTSRMSPGDRMIWSDIAKNSNDETRKLIMEANWKGVEMCFTGWVSKAASVVDWFLDLW